MGWTADDKMDFCNDIWSLNSSQFLQFTFRATTNLFLTSGHLFQFFVPSQVKHDGVQTDDHGEIVPARIGSLHC